LAVWLGSFKLDCRKCSPEDKEEYGCEFDSPILGKWKLDDWEFQRCPVKIVTYQSFEYIRAYNFLQRFHGWPNPGTWQEQPLKLIEAIEIIEREVSRIEEMKMEELKNKK